MTIHLGALEDRSARYLEVVRGLADQIWNRRVHAKDQSVTWFRPGRVEQEGSAVRIDPFLYDGTCGIAVAFAALSRVTGEAEYRDRSLQVIASLRYRMGELVAAPPRAAKLRLCLGGGIGLGSIIYSFLQLSRLLDEPALASEASALLTLLTEERIAADERLDVLYGSAGAILVLLALHRAMPGARWSCTAPLEIASACARHLVTSRSPAGSYRVWKTFPVFPPLSGFSHGAAGICYALLRLYAETGAPWLLEAVEEGLAFERSHYYAEHRNWRDLRKEKLSFGSAWCTGAPGIALARVGALDVLDDACLREEIDIGLETTERLPLSILDHLCCGNMGRVEILFQASRRLRDEELSERVERLVQAVLDRANTSGFRWRYVQDSETFDPTFFTGAAGIAYSLLRLVAPDDLACMLLLE